MKPHQKTFDRIREAVLPEFRERVADYLADYEHVLQAPRTADLVHGHAAALLEAGVGRVVGVDRDPEAVAEAAFAVESAHRHHGLGSALIRRRRSSAVYWHWECGNEPSFPARVRFRSSPRRCAG